MITYSVSKVNNCFNFLQQHLYPDQSSSESFRFLSGFRLAICTAAVLSGIPMPDNKCQMPVESYGAEPYSFGSSTTLVVFHDESDPPILMMTYSTRFVNKKIKKRTWV